MTDEPNLPHLLHYHGATASFCRYGSGDVLCGGKVILFDLTCDELIVLLETRNAELDEATIVIDGLRKQIDRLRDSRRKLKAELVYGKDAKGG